MIKLLKKLTKHLSIFNEVDQLWSNQKFDGKYVLTEQFCGGCDTLEMYRQIKDPRYSETEINYHYNENDFRIPSRDYTPDNTKQTIACFGCSNTFGAGLPWKETWPAQLEQMLGEKFIAKNYGLCGASGDQIVRLASIYLETFKPTALLCLLPDIFRREFFENNRNKLSLKQFYLAGEMGPDDVRKDLMFKGINAIDWLAYKRLSKPDNSIYNFIKNVKFIEAIATSKQVPLYIFSWDSYLIDIFHKKHFESPSICIPRGEDIRDFKQAESIKARDDHHLGVHTNRIIAAIFYQGLRGREII